MSKPIDRQIHTTLSKLFDRHERIVIRLPLHQFPPEIRDTLLICIPCLNFHLDTSNPKEDYILVGRYAYRFMIEPLLQGNILPPFICFYEIFESRYQNPHRDRNA